MFLKYSVLLGVALFASYQIVQISSRVELTNLQCLPRDKPFADFEYCRIKAVNRTYKYVTIKINLFQVPITNVSVNVSILKRLNGYKPFLYNITFDACKFLASKNKNPLTRYFYSFIGDYSNMNHTCPYNEDLIVDKFTLVKVLPFPEGHYAVFTSWYAYGLNRADVNLYFDLS